jgi:hypothetical protein
VPKILGPREKDGRPYRRGRPVSDAAQARGRAYVSRDHQTMPVKVALRRWLLSRMGLDSVHVLDACSGDGLIWTEMEKHVDVLRWVRTDVKPRPNGHGGMVLKMSAAQAVDAMDLHEFNVIDIDPYGEPWEAYHLVLERFSQPTAVFLTHGRTAHDLTDSVKEWMGIPKAWPLPQVPSVVEYVQQRALAESWRYATVTHAARVYRPPSGTKNSSVTYFAIGLRPRD